MVTFCILGTVFVSGAFAARFGRSAHSLVPVRAPRLPELRSRPPF